MKKIVVAAVMYRCNQIFLQKRPVNKPPQGLEFPGGKVEPGESLNEALQRELLEELDFAGLPGDEIMVIRRPEVELHFIRVIPRHDWHLVPREGQSGEWYALNGAVPAGLLPNDYPVWQFLSKYAD